MELQTTFTLLLYLLPGVKTLRSETEVATWLSLASPFPLSSQVEVIDVCGHPCKLYVVYKCNSPPFYTLIVSPSAINIPEKFLPVLCMKVGQSPYPTEMTDMSVRLPH